MTAWSDTTLGAICQIKPPKKEAKQKLSDADKVSFVPMNNLGICTKDIELNEDKALGEVAGSYTYFAEGDVLLAKITPCFENGKLGIARGLTNGIGFGSSEFVVFRSKGSVDPEFLFYFLSQDSFRESGARIMTGAVGHKRITNEFIESHPIKLPPLPEQKRIAVILDETFAGIDVAIANTEKNLVNARELFESYLNAVFTEAYAGNRLVPLLEIATDITDGDHMPPPKSEAGVPFITIGNINKRTREIDFSDTFKVPREYFEGLKANRKPQRGDILYTVTGSFGIPVIVEGNTEFCFQRHIGLIRPKTNIDSRWLNYLLLSPQVFQQANERATGTAQKTVSLKVLRSITIPLIPPAKQREDADKLDAVLAEVQRFEAIYEQKLDALAELKQSILQKAFSGELSSAPEKSLEEAM